MIKVKLNDKNVTQQFKQRSNSRAIVDLALICLRKLPRRAYATAGTPPPTGTSGTRRVKRSMDCVSKKERKRICD